MQPQAQEILKMIEIFLSYMLLKKFLDRLYKLSFGSHSDHIIYENVKVWEERKALFIPS